MARELVYAVGCGLLVIAFRQYWRLRHVPGPPGAGFSKWWLVRATLNGTAHLETYQVCEKYGSVARIGPNHLINSDPDLMRRMWNVQTPYKRSDWYKGLRLDPCKDNVPSQRNDKVHIRLRSKMAAGYSGKEVDKLEAKVDENVLALVNLLDSKYVSADRPFDFGRKVEYFTLDVISDLAFGQPFGHLTADADVRECISELEASMPTIMLACVLPWIMDVMSSGLLRWTMPPEKDLVGLGSWKAIAKQVAAERFGPDKKVQRDMIGSFVAHGLSQSEAESEILLQILAGADTSATAIRATMLHTMSNPRVMNKLAAEINELQPTWPAVTKDEAQAMPHLQAVVKEGLRIFPPVVALMSREVPAGGDTFKGMFLPEGTKMAVCPWGIGRRSDVFGEDAREFRPERWIEASAEKRKQMEATADLVFGHGRWQCLGRNVALNKVLVELVRRLELSVVDPRGYGVFLQSEFWVKATRRASDDGSVLGNRNM